MSAYMVDNEHINVMVWAAVELASPADLGPVFTYTAAAGAHPVRVSATDRDSMDFVGQMLVSSNAASMAARYGEENHAYNYTYTRPQRTDWTIVDILGALSCYEYQACEVGDFEDTHAGRFCDQLRRGLVHRLTTKHDAPWEIRPDSTPAHAAA